MVARSAAGALLALFVGLASFGCARHHYALTPVLSWTEAEAYANSLGGHLVAINSQAEQDLLVSLFGGTEPFWIGLNREADGAFVCEQR